MVLKWAFFCSKAKLNSSNQAHTSISGTWWIIKSLEALLCGVKNLLAPELSIGERIPFLASD